MEQKIRNKYIFASVLPFGFTALLMMTIINTRVFFTGMGGFGDIIYTLMGIYLGLIIFAIVYGVYSYKVFNSIWIGTIINCISCFVRYATYVDFSKADNSSDIMNLILQIILTFIVTFLSSLIAKIIRKKKIED